MMRAASRVQRKVPVRLTMMTFSHSSSGMSTSSKGFSIPALLTSRSRPPNASRASAKPRWTSASTVTSISTGTARPPAASMAATIARAVVDLAAMVDRHRGAVRGELECGSLAYAAGGAGDQRAAAPSRRASGGCRRKS